MLQVTSSEYIIHPGTCMHTFMQTSILKHAYIQKNTLAQTGTHEPSLYTSIWKTLSLLICNIDKRNQYNLTEVCHYQSLYYSGLLYIYMYTIYQKKVTDYLFPLISATEPTVPEICWQSSTTPNTRTEPLLLMNTETQSKISVLCCTYFIRLSPSQVHTISSKSLHLQWS